MAKRHGVLWRAEDRGYNNCRPHGSVGYPTPAQFATRYYEKNQAEERQIEEKAGILSFRVILRMGATQMNFRSAVETHTRRASRYGDYIRTYSEPALALLMLESLRIETGLKAIDLGYGQGDSSKHSRAVGADVVYVDGNRDMLLHGIERGDIPGGSAISCRQADHHPPFSDSLYGVSVIRYASHGVSDERGLVKEIHKTLKPSAKLQIVDMCATREDHVFFYGEVHSCKTSGPPLESSILSKVKYEAEYESIAKSTDRVKEEQITRRRHAYLSNLVRERLRENPGLEKASSVALKQGYSTVHFPVIIMVVEATKEETSHEARTKN